MVTTEIKTLIEEDVKDAGTMTRLIATRKRKKQKLKINWFP
jgi:hypothetical protein